MVEWNPYKWLDDDPRAEQKRINRDSAQYMPTKDAYAMGAGMLDPTTGNVVQTPAEAEARRLRDSADAAYKRGYTALPGTYDPGISDLSRGAQLGAASSQGLSAQRINNLGSEQLQFAGREGPASVAAPQQLIANDSLMRQALGSGAVGAQATGARGDAASRTAAGLAGQRAVEADAWQGARLGAMGDAADSFGGAGNVLSGRAKDYADVRAGDIRLQEGALDYAGAQDRSALGWADNAMTREGLAFDYLSNDLSQKQIYDALATGQGQHAADIALRERQRQAAADAARRDAYLRAGGEVATAAASADWGKGGDDGRAARDRDTEWSDERLKTDIAPTSAAERFAGVGSYRYKYKDPEHGPGEHIGPMAQDLEKAGFTDLVIETPIGKKVNTSRLALVNTAAIADQQRELEALRKELEDLRNG